MSPSHQVTWISLASRRATPLVSYINYVLYALNKLKIDL